MRSRELDKIIKADEKRLAKEVKLLLLGTNDSNPYTTSRKHRLYCKIIHSLTAGSVTSYANTQIFNSLLQAPESPESLQS